MNVILKIFLCISIGIPHWHYAIARNDLHCSFWADYNQFDKKHTIAYAWYNKLLASPQCPGYMYKGLVHLLHQTNNNNRIISLMPTLEQSFKHDTEMQLLFAQALQKTGQNQSSDEKILTLLTQAKDNQQVALNAAQIFFRRKEPENALSTIQDYLAHAHGNPNNFIFHFLAAQVYLGTDKPKEAIKEIQYSLDLHPTFDKGWLMLALLHEQTGKLQEAIHAYITHLEISEKPCNTLKEHLLQLVLRKKIVESGKPTINVNNSDLTQALTLLKEGKYKKAVEYLEAIPLSEAVKGNFLESRS